MKKSVLTFLFCVAVLPLIAQQPKSWEFHSPNWRDASPFTQVNMVDGLVVLANPDNTVTVDSTYKVFIPGPTQQFTFTRMLNLRGNAIMAPGYPNLPLSGAVAFEVSGPGKITAIATSANSDPTKLYLSDGMNHVGAIPCQSNTYLEANGNMLTSYSMDYTGGPTTLFLYNAMAETHLYYLEATSWKQPAPFDSVEFKVNVPEGTKECWVVGNFNNWNNAANKMNKIDDRTYQLKLYNVSAQGLEYKYLSGPGDWVFVEKDANGNEIPDRTYQPYDTVARWNAVYDPGSAVPGKLITFEITVPFNVLQLNVAGSFNNWNPGDSTSYMSEIGQNTSGKIFRKTVWVNYPEGLEYKFCAGPDWTYVQVQENNYRIPNADLDTIRHRVVSFYSYANSPVQPLNWMFSYQPFNSMPTYNSVTDEGGLRIYGSEDVPMFIDMDSKHIDQLPFTHRLHTGGPGRAEAATPLKPYANAVAFNVGPDAQVYFSALSDGNEDAVLLITNGVDTLAWGNIPAGVETDSTLVPRWQFRYQGIPTTLYMFTTNVGINYYFLGVTDYRGLPYEGPETTYTVTVPADTRQVCIAGEFNNWQPGVHWMQQIDSVTYMLTVQGATEQMPYKYLNGPDWNYVEVYADGTERPNRGWSQLDTVPRWLNMYYQEETKFFYDNISTIPGENISLTIRSQSNMPKQAIAYQFQLQYDPNVLEYLGHNVDGTIAQTGTVVVNSTRDMGTLYVSFMTDNPFSYTSDLLKLNFRVKPNSYYNFTKCWINNAYLNDQFINWTESGDILIETYKVGDVDGNYWVQAYDAALTLQYSVGKDPLPEIDPLPWSLWRMRAADVDGLEGITANDAALILQYSAYMIDQFPIENDTTDRPAMIRGTDFADITITRENNQLVVRSYGKLVGLNLFLNEFSSALGTPIISSSVDMSAVNISNEVYAIGLASLQAPADGTVIMTMPLNETSLTEYVFTAFINAHQKEISSKVITSTEETRLSVVQLYPNPARDYLNITGLTEGSEFRISDISGRTVYSAIATSTAMEVSVGNLSGGVYTVTVVTDGRREVTRFIKQ